MCGAQHPRGAKPQRDALISYVRIAYTSRIHHAFVGAACITRHGVVTLEWKQTGRGKEAACAATKERKRECKGRFQVGAPFVVGRCFRLCRPCRLINNTISLSSCVSQFFFCLRFFLLPPTPVFCLPCPGDTWPLASLINNT